MAGNAHSSYRVWQRIVNQDFRKMAPGLKVKKKSETYLAVFLVAAGVAVGAFGGLFVGGRLNPPVQLFGVCEAPAQLTNGGCFLLVTSTSPQGQTLVTYQPAGYLEYLNGTRYRG